MISKRTRSMENARCKKTLSEQRNLTKIKGLFK